MTGCTATHTSADICYPELPDNEYCFRKIAEFRDFCSRTENRKTEMTHLPDGQEVTEYVITPPYTIEAYLGILEGRGAIEKRQMAVTQDQARAIFHASPMPEFLLDAGSAYDPDPNASRIVTFYYPKGSRPEFEAWLKQILPASNRPQHDRRALFLAGNKDCILLEPVSPALIQYEWQIGSDHVGALGGLMPMRPPTMTGNDSQLSFDPSADWEKFKALAKDNPAFYGVWRSEESVSGTHKGTVRKTVSEKRALIILGENGEALWEQVLAKSSFSSETTFRFNMN